MKFWLWVGLNSEPILPFVTQPSYQFSLLLVFPCYQTFAAVPVSPESDLVTRLSLSLLLNCPCYQFFAATNLPLLPDFHCCPRQPRILVRVYLSPCHARPTYREPSWERAKIIRFSWTLCHFEGFT